jgi:ABC-2 type transport system ATP-binding protein
MQPEIEVRELSKTYSAKTEAEEVHAVRGIDFRVASGEVFGLLGPNGAGKSTTIGMLTTTIAPTHGTARLAGVDVVAEPIAARAASSVVFQDAVVDRGLPGRRNLAIHARLWGVDRPTAKLRIDDVVDAFGLGDVVDRPVASYSGGQRRRLEIARALLSQPRVLFLDEPTVGLDPRIRFELLDLIASLRSRGGMTIVLTTHYLDEAERLCDRVAIMHEGRIVAADTPGVLLAQLGRELIELRVDRDAPRVLERLQRNGVAGADAFVVGATITVPLHDRSAASAITEIQEVERVAAIGVRPSTLDDVYLRLTGDRIASAA